MDTSAYEMRSSSLVRLLITFSYSSKNSYQFTYSDASSGGALTNKTFANSISYNTMSCSLTVQVQRKAYIAPAGQTTDTLTADDFTATGTTYSDFSGVTKTSGAVYAGNSAKNNNANIQLRTNNSNSGIVSTASGGTIQSVKITVASGSNTIQVYGKNVAYSSASELYSSSTQGTLVGSTTSTGTITFSTNYQFIGIRSGGNAVYISQIQIVYGSNQTPANVANYIMYEDTNNQCTSKFSVAKGYFENLSKADRNTFMTSDDYVISTARDRLQKWAAHLGKTITQSGDDYVISARNISIDYSNNSNISIFVIVIIINASAFGTFLFLRKKKRDK